jgi:hypothetical protein
MRLRAGQAGGPILRDPAAGRTVRSAARVTGDSTVPRQAGGQRMTGGDAVAGAPEETVRAWRDAGRLAEAAALAGRLGPYGAADGPDGTVALGAAVLEAYGDQLAAAGDHGADAVYQQAAAAQRSFAAAATAGAEGLARMAEAGRIERKRRA